MQVHLTKALRTLLGLDPSAGSMFDRNVDRLAMDSSDEEDGEGGAVAQDDSSVQAPSAAASPLQGDIPTSACKCHVVASCVYTS